MSLLSDIRRVADYDIETALFAREDFDKGDVPDKRHTPRAPKRAASFSEVVQVFGQRFDLLSPLHRLQLKLAIGTFFDCAIKPHLSLSGTVDSLLQIVNLLFDICGAGINQFAEKS